MLASLPTDRQILQCIFDRYQSQYPGEDGKNDPYMPIDVPAIATELGCSKELLFGRLHYALDRKYGYTADGGGKVHLFAIKVGEEMHCINFPYLVSALADLTLEHRRVNWTRGLAIFAAVLSVIGIIVQLSRPPAPSSTPGSPTSPASQGSPR